MKSYAEKLCVTEHNIQDDVIPPCARVCPNEHHGATQKQIRPRILGGRAETCLMFRVLVWTASQKADQITAARAVSRPCRCGGRQRFPLGHQP